MTSEPESFETASSDKPSKPVGRSLPNSEDAEEAVLSYCMYDGADAVARCVLAGVTTTSFYGDKRSTVFQAILSLYNAQKPIAADTVAESLRSSLQLEGIGGFAYVAKLSKTIPTTATAQYFIAKLNEQAALRALIMSRTETVEACYAFAGGDIEPFLSEVAVREEKAIRPPAEDESDIQTEARAILAELSVPRPQRVNAKEISWGLLDVDRTCGKMAAGTLNVLAGMPSTGKSALADQCAWINAAQGKHVVMFTYEMTKRDKAVRIAQQLSRLNIDDYDDSPLDRRAVFNEALRKIMACRSLRVFERDVAVNRLVARTKALAARGPIDLVIVDFLQYLARIEIAVGRESMNEKVGRMTAALKNVAKVSDCPVLLLSSLNRDGYKDGNRPNLASLRSSGEIESDADVVAILHWPSERVDGSSQDPHDPTGVHFEVEFNQDKGRSKGVHRVLLGFDRKSTRFDNFQR